jgi:hypothetical protein
MNYSEANYNELRAIALISAAGQLGASARIVFVRPPGTARGNASCLADWCLGLALRNPLHEFFQIG